MEVDLQSRNYTLPMSALGNLKLETRSWEGTKPGHPFSTILSYQFPQIGGLIAVPSFRWFVALLDVYLVVMMHMFFYVLLTFSVTGALDPIKKQDGLQIIHSWPKSLHCHEKEFLRKIRPPPPPPPSPCPLFNVAGEALFVHQCDLGLMQQWLREEREGTGE